MPQGKSERGNRENVVVHPARGLMRNSSRQLFSSRKQKSEPRVQNEVPENDFEEADELSEGGEIPFLEVEEHHPPPSAQPLNEPLLGRQANGPGKFKARLNGTDQRGDNKPRSRVTESPKTGESAEIAGMRTERYKRPPLEDNRLRVLKRRQVVLEPKTKGVDGGFKLNISATNISETKQSSNLSSITEVLQSNGHPQLRKVLPGASESNHGVTASPKKASFSAPPGHSQAKEQQRGRETICIEQKEIPAPKTPRSKLSQEDDLEAARVSQSNPIFPEPSIGTPVITDDLDEHMKESVKFEFFDGKVLRGKASLRSIGTNASMWEYATNCGLDTHRSHISSGILAIRSASVPAPPYGILPDNAELFEDMKADLRRFSCWERGVTGVWEGECVLQVRLAD